MLENEPNSGADGTAGTTETTETTATDQPITTAAPQSGEVRVNTPGSQRRGGVRSAGPPPEPETGAATVEPLTSIAGDVGLATEVIEPAADGERPVAEEEEAHGPDSVAVVTEEDTSITGSASVSEVTRPNNDGNGSTGESVSGATSLFQPPMVVFQPPVAHQPTTPAGRGHATTTDEDTTPAAAATTPAESADAEGEDGSEEDRPSRRRRRRGGRGRGKSRPGDESTDGDDDAVTGEATPVDQGGTDTEQVANTASETDDAATETTGDSGDSSRGTRRRRRRRRSAGEAGESESAIPDDPPNTVVKVREPRKEKDKEKQPEAEVQSVKGSTRLEAKKQRRREGREQGRRRAPVITESEFLARRESVKRDLVIRRSGDRTQIAVLEDDVLVEHYVDRAAHKSYVGNVYLGRVQNVLPSMEAAFVDIGKGRNAVLYAGEVNWDSSGLEGQPKRIESVLKSGQSVLVQVTKDPMGHKGARLTSQISLPGRYLVYVPDGSMTGISRKLPDKERARLKQILKKVMPENAGVIVRTAAEGASEEELERDISRLASQWESIKRKSKSASAPSLLSSEPDLTVRVVRDVFNEDFASLVVSGDEAWSTVKEYVDYVAPHLAERLTHWRDERDIFEAYRVDEQIAKALERKVWLPSGGSLIIDRTEAMTVVDVNTGKFTGQGGNLEETVTKNNLEAAEEIVRQLRLRDIGGIIVIDFIDMVLESNRDLVLRRMLECLSRDRTKHQVAEVTSLGLVQMTRKRVGQGLLEAFSHSCEHCNGRGLVLSTEPVENKGGSGSGGGSANGRKKKAKGGSEKSTRAEVTSSSEASDDEPAPAAEAPAEAAGGATDAAASTDAPTDTDATGDSATTKSSSRRAKGTTRKSGTRKSRTTKKDADADATAANPTDEDTSGDAAQQDAADSGESESTERPRRRTRRSNKVGQSGTESASTSAPAVAEAG